MEKSFACPFCSAVNPVIKETTIHYLVNFETLATVTFDWDILYRNGNRYTFDPAIFKDDKDTILVTFNKCSRCNEIATVVRGVSEYFRDLKININPKFSCKKYPEYIPAPILADYEEACEIQNISPKASATLARRCMQGIIRDFWGVEGANLYNEIDQIKSKVDPELWEGLNSLREIGNIGAHMQKDINLIVDIEPEEVSSLIQFIELLLEEWYIARYKKQELLSRIPLINISKQEQRKVIPEDAPPL